MKMTGPSKNAGFSLAELIGVVVIIGILAGGGALMLSNASKQARNAVKYNNAAEATRVFQNIRAAGGDAAGSCTGAGADGSGSVDYANAGTIIDALEKGITVAGISFKLSSDLNNAAYTVKAGTSGWDSVIVPVMAGSEPDDSQKP